MTMWNFQTPDMTSMVKGLSSQAQQYGQKLGAFGASMAAGAERPDPMQNGATMNATYGQDYHPVQRGTAADAKYYRDLGFNENVPLSLIHTESSGRWNAENNVEGANGKKGHYGILQFGHARLSDAIQAGAIPQMTPEQFMGNSKAQIAAANWHFNDIDRRIFKNGLDRYLGQNVGGVNITMDALRAMAHLGGFGGMRSYLRTGGGDNRADAYGTSLRKYGQIHG